MGSENNLISLVTVAAGGIQILQFSKGWSASPDLPSRGLPKVSLV